MDQSNLPQLNETETIIYGLSYREMLSEFEELCRRIIPEWNVENVNDDLVKVSRLWLQAIARSNKFASGLVQETNPVTAKDVRAIQSWFQLFGLKLRTRQPAIASVLLRYNVLSDIVIDPYDLELTVTSDTGVSVSFSNVTTILLKPSQTQTSAIFAEGKNFLETITYNGQESFVLSQRFVVDELFLNKSMYLKVNGVLWTRVDEMQEVNQLDNVYDVSIDNNEQARIIFGNSIFGRKPEKSSKIEVFYRICAGTLGNVTATFEETTPTKQLAIRDQQRFSFIQEAVLLGDTAGASNPPTIREAKQILLSGFNYKGQLNNNEDINRYLLQLPGISQAKTESFLFDIVSYVTIEYFSDFVKESIQRDVQMKLANLFGYSLFKADETVLSFRIEIFKVPTVSDQFVRNEAFNYFYRFLNYSNKDTLTGRYTNPIGDVVYLSPLAFMVKSINGVFDYVISARDQDGNTVASTQTTSSIKSFYLNEPNAVTSLSSTVDIIISSQ